MDIIILPMAKQNETFEGSIEKAREYFVNTLKEEKGWYYYETKGLNALEGSEVYFQFDNHLIASATFDMNMKFKSGEYAGALIFDVDTIKMFEPISAEELLKYAPDFKKFSQVKQRLTINGDFVSNLCYL